MPFTGFCVLWGTFRGASGGFSFFVILLIVVVLDFVFMTKSRVRLSFLMSAEFMGSMAANFMTYGIFFYTEKHLGWSLLNNCLLGAALGVVYLFAAMAAHPIQLRVRRIVWIRFSYAMMALLGLMVLIKANSFTATLAVLLYAFFAGASWPMLESLVSGNASGRRLSKRLGLYNIVWSTAGVMLMFVVGLVMKYNPALAWMIVAGAHVLGTASFFAGKWESDPEPAVESKLEVSEKLIAQRRLAMQLSRISLPATYVLMNGMAAMLPSLLLIKSLPDTTKTMYGSAWMVSRVITFIVLTVTTFWQSKPRMLLWACVMMFVSFLAMVIPAAKSDAPWVLYNFLFWQIGLGVAIGHIYAASLYFGMALSDGSTEHGGYHEALIGLGLALGPASGAVGAYLYPGQTFFSAIAVGIVIALSLFIAIYVAVRSTPPSTGK